MTVVRLKSGDFFIHSQIKLDPALQAELAPLGRVRFVVAPNKWHHLFVGEYFKTYPQAEVYGAPGLETKRSDLTFHGILNEGSEPPWGPEIEHFQFRALKFFNKIVFLRHPTRTLTLTDTVFNIQRADSIMERMFFRLDRAWQHFGPTLIEKPFLLLNCRVAREDVDRILRWDFDRVIMAHGEVLERGGRAAIRNAFAFLKRVD